MEGMYAEKAGAFSVAMTVYLNFIQSHFILIAFTRA